MYSSLTLWTSLAFTGPTPPPACVPAASGPTIGNCRWRRDVLSHIVPLRCDTGTERTNHMARTQLGLAGTENRVVNSMNHSVAIRSHHFSGFFRPHPDSPTRRMLLLTSGKSNHQRFCGVPDRVASQFVIDNFRIVTPIVSAYFVASDLPAAQ